MKSLIHILPQNIEYQLIGNENLSITGLSQNSKTVKKGEVFFAIKGENFDGHKFIPKGIEKGVKVFVVSEKPKEIDSEISYVYCKNVRKMMGKMAAAFYDYPSADLDLIGVVGTNGKTTVATLLHELFMKYGIKTGLISTIENKIGEKSIQTEYTTPDPIAINALLHKMRNEECVYVFMEVSSHAMAQERVHGLEFKTGVFTNITHEHLDYHKTFKSYLKAKKKFFDLLPAEATAIVNIDDKNGEVMVQNCDAKIKSYALRRLADYKCKISFADLMGMQLQINGTEIFVQLTGQFNAYNLLAVYAVSREEELDKNKVFQIMTELKGVEGRFEMIRSRNGHKIGIVDFAHTPDALENVLKNIKKVAANTTLITVIGCGGNRDKLKRPKMAKIGADYSDLLILTSDNPRNEEPESIIDDMEKGLDVHEKKRMFRIADRRQAIKMAVHLLKEKGIILVAGKGHEKYQITKGKKIPFDDKLILKAFLLEDFKD